MRHRQHRVAVVDVLEQALLEDATILRPEGLVLLAVSGRMSLIVVRTFLVSRRRIALICRSCCRISRETFSDRSCASTTPVHEAQVFRHQLFAVVHDEHPFDVQLHAALVLALNRSNGAFDGMNSRAWYSKVPSAFIADGLERVVPGVADVPVELGILLVGDLRARPGPQRLLRVQGLGRGHLGGCVVAFSVSSSAGFGGAGLVTSMRMGHEMKSEYFLTSLADLRHRRVVVQVVLGVLGLEVQRHRRTLRRALDLFDRVRAGALGLPAGGVGLARLAGQQGDLVGDHERRVEADAELADQLFRRRRVLGFLQLLPDLRGARLRQRADQVDHLVARHADAVVGDREGARFGVDVDLDVKIRGVGVEILVPCTTPSAACRGRPMRWTPALAGRNLCSSRSSGS